MNVNNKQEIHSNHNLLWIFDRHYQRIIKIGNAILLIILSCILLFLGILGDLPLNVIYFKLVLISLGLFCLSTSILIIKNFRLPSDIKLFEDGIEFLSEEGVATNKTIFLSFNNIKTINMVQIPIGIKCVIIITNDNKYNITSKEIQNIEEFYKRLSQEFNSHIAKGFDIFTKESN
jgi:hypothetical protein